MLAGIGLLNLLVVVVYFGLVVAIGVRSSRHVENQEDFFLAGRRFGKFVQTFTAFGTGTNVESPVGVATTTFTNGAAGTWSSLVYLFVTPIYWLIAPWMRRLRVLTMADYLEERYGSKGITGLYTLVAVLLITTHLAVGFSAAAKTVVALVPKDAARLTTAEKAEIDRSEQLSQLREADYSSLSDHDKARLAQLASEAPRRFISHVNPNVLIWILCFVVMIYGIVGGLEAASLTDALQGMTIIVMTVLLFPFCWARINAVHGGSTVLDALRTVHATLPESFFQILGSPALMDFTWYYVVALSVMTISNTPAQAHFLTSLAAARNEYVCRFGATWGAYIKRFCAVLWGFFALCALAVFHGQINDPDLMWGYACRELLQPAGFGLLGLMIACLMAALMSTADMQMITGAGLLTRNIYRPLFPSRDETHYVRVGRLVGIVVIVSGAFIATQFDTILQLLKFMWEINVMVAATWWLGMKWRRANRAGAWASMTVAAVFFFILPLALPAGIPSLRANDFLQKTTRAVPVSHVYRAHEMDVETREAEIARWRSLPEGQQSQTVEPRPLAVGEAFMKTVMVPARSIFWTKGLKGENNGTIVGTGMLSLELIALDRLGVDLSRNTYAMNETIRVTIRTIVPFLILICVSRLTPPENKTQLDRFFAKMATVVQEDREADSRELELSYAQPSRFEHRKLFPGSQWEFWKWNKVDTIGFLLAVLCAFAVLGFLKLLLTIGA